MFPALEAAMDVCMASYYVSRETLLAALPLRRGSPIVSSFYYYLSE